MTDAAAIAATVLKAIDDGGQMEPFTTANAGLTEADAYAVTARLRALRMARGERPVGRKIGFSNPNIWDEYGVREPIWGYVYQRTVVRLAGAQASCALGRFAEPRIEPEIVLGFRAAPRAGADLAELAAALD